MDKMIRMCLNWKVIGGLTVVGLGIWLAAPSLLVAALPVLLMAVCPLSMLLMMKAMDGGHRSSQPDSRTDDAVAPSPEVRIAELRSKRETLDRKISALEEEETGARGAAPLPDGEGRDHLR
jgi:hypothetical protein